MDNNGRGRGWRGGGYNKRFTYRKWNKGRGGNGGQNNNRGSDCESNGNGSPQAGSSRGRGWVKRGGHANPGPSSVENNTPPPSRKKRRTDQLSSIKASVEAKWKKILPGYDYYYSDHPPQLPEPEVKILAVDRLLKEFGFVQSRTVGTCKYKREYVLYNEEYAFSLNYAEIVKNEEFLKQWPNFGSDLRDEPEETIALWSATAHRLLSEVILTQMQENEDSDEFDKSKTPIIVMKIRFGFLKTEPVVPLIHLRSEYIGKFVTISGAVAGAGSIRPYHCRLTFKCRVCEEKFSIDQTYGQYTLPDVCKASDDCKNSGPWAFDPDESAPTTIYIDSRRIRVQDISHCDSAMGTVPKTIDCLLLGGWADQCNTGDLVTLSGIVKVGIFSGQSTHQTYIEVSSVQQQKDSERTIGGSLLTLTDKDYHAVKAIYDEPDLFRLLIASLCPSIFGHDIVKAGLLLCLLGGTQKDEGLISRRSDINMLMVGDPGIGKSQMLKVIQEVAPKAVYVCGTSSTVAGLTVSLSKDGDDYSLDAGALVMADLGICCIDEFDKMTSQHHALLECMEQQCVSVAKSGVQRSLPARTTVIAAANPVGGHYNPTKTVCENIKIKPPVLSRFDLIFILLDTPNEEFDDGLVAHKASLRMGRRPTMNLNGSISNSVSSRQNGETERLCDRIKVGPGEVMDLIPHELLRKYIAYAKQYVHPNLSLEAAEILKSFYLKLRITRQMANSTPITARQLESLKRLAEARAKLELREVVTAADAKDVVEIFEYSLCSAFDDEVRVTSALSESILLDTSFTSGASKAKSTQAQAKQLLNALQTVAQRQSKNLFSIDEIKSIIRGLGYSEKTEALITALNNLGFLINQGGRTYKLIISEF